jgi:2-polyprenyl-3-methyl-5-hydroxy-6-metoxy-1,4-benzoquinol methylase
VQRSYKLYGLIHECVVDAGAKTHEVLWPDPELVEFIGRVGQERVSCPEPDGFAGPARVPSGAPIIDLGCGAGRNAVWLAQQGFHVTAIDVSPHAVQLARAFAAETGVQIDAVEADVTDLSEFPENHYDLAYDGRCLHLIVEQELRDAYLKNVLRLLRPSGTYFAINIGGRDEEQARSLAATDGKPYQYVCEGIRRVERLLPSAPVAPMWPEQHTAELQAAGFDVESVTYVETRRPPAGYQIRTLATKPGASSAG